MSEPLDGRTGLATLFAAMLPPVPIAAPEPEPIDMEALAAEWHRRGFAEGEASADARLLPLRRTLVAAADAFDAATTIDPARLRTPFVAIVTALAEAVVMGELAVSPVIGRLVDTALTAVDATGAAMRLHPDDICRLGPAPLPVTGDPTLPQGTVIVEGPDFVVRDGLAERLAAILADIA